MQFEIIHTANRGLRTEHGWREAFVPFMASASWLRKRILQSRHLITTEEYAEQVQSMDLPALQAQCRKRKLSTDGDTHALRVRLLDGIHPLPEREEEEEVEAEEEEPAVGIDLHVELHAALEANDYNSVRSIVGKLTSDSDIPTPKGKEPLYALAHELLGVDSEEE